MKLGWSRRETQVGLSQPKNLGRKPVREPGRYNFDAWLGGLPEDLTVEPWNRSSVGGTSGSDDRRPGWKAWVAALVIFAALYAFSVWYHGPDPIVSDGSWII